MAVLGLDGDGGVEQGGHQPGPEPGGQRMVMSCDGLGLAKVSSAANGRADDEAAAGRLTGSGGERARSSRRSSI